MLIEGDTEVGWLAMDKQNGHLTFLKYDLEDTQAPVYEVLKEDIVERIKHVKEVVEHRTRQKDATRLCQMESQWEPETRYRLLLLSLQTFVLSPVSHILYYS